ncbi:MAG: outer membrane lipoprotein-sorting protein [Verrucomicrobium sp.]|nr:outer membrane lipoprotein-sorting protein [Verrucomicrobium sp.]
MKQAKYPLTALVLAGLLVSLRAAPDPQKPTPPPALVQARVFRNFTLEDFTLEGDIHTKKDSYPITLRTHDHEMVYQFKDQPLQVRVLLDPMGATVFRRKGANDPWQQVTGRALVENILRTDLTYEDIGLGFIFWDRLVGVGSDSIKTLPAWAFEAEPPEGILSRYAKVRYWISSDYYAFLRVDGYNAKGQVVKRVEVNGVQKIGEAYVIKEMQVSTMIPGTEVSATRTYIDVSSGKPGSGLGQ